MMDTEKLKDDIAGLSADSYKSGGLCIADTLIEVLGQIQKPDDHLTVQEIINLIKAARGRFLAGLQENNNG